MNNGVWFDPHPQRIAAAKAAANASTAAKDGNSEGSDAASESTTLLEEEEREHDEIERYRTLVTAFYKQHAPLKVAQVDKLLKKYSNDLKHMYRVLHLKYNVPFPGEEGARAPAIVRRPTGMPRPPRSTRSTSTHSQSSSRCDEACPSPAVATSGIASTKVMTPVTSPTSSTDTLAVDSEAHVDTSSTAAEMVEAVTVAVKKVSFSEPQAEPTTEEASLPLEAAVAAPAADVPTAPEQTESPMLNKMHEKPGSIPPCCCTIS
ncbi:TPA: hypothetical protein N0F65_001851 [Lagenidium giganteum]|uniref:Uncharacterized protein n=1 Tax=Lagenidium giganteum TaxID=4803 RepID=A0AAV2YKJ0_9STRA|nr:TPA: hypothetical protein N0F65_001851 [Lagenidium giganteum]